MRKDMAKVLVERPRLIDSAARRRRIVPDDLLPKSIGLRRDVREAGGFVSDYRGRSLPVCDKQVLAGNDPLHSRLHKLIAGAVKA